ncbi:MAG: hypothetical protein FWF41_04860 [Betaproteobacteria bacterium]|nr:hypothetical protein [Betaproteobacteria bacterium]
MEGRFMFFLAKAADIFLFVVRKTPLVFFWLFGVRMWAYFEVNENFSVGSLSVNEVFFLFSLSVIVTAIGAVYMTFVKWWINRCPAEIAPKGR